MKNSVSNTRYIAITTPVVVIYPGSDFKIDNTPVDGLITDEALIRQISSEGVLGMLIDSKSKTSWQYMISKCIQ